MRKSYFLYVVFVGLLVCWSLSLADTYKDFYDKPEATYTAKADYAKDVGYYTEILKIEPERCDAIYCRAVNYFRLKRYDEALADFDKVKDVNNIDHHVLHYIGLIRNEKQDYRAALDAFMRAVDLQPENSQYCLDAARAAMKANSRASALMLYEQAIEIDPTNEEAAIYIKACRAAIAAMDESWEGVEK